MTPEWDTSCKDWESRIVEGRSLIPFDPLFPGEAKDALDVFRELRIVDAIGSPTMGEACRPWILDFVGHVFGAYDPDSGRRLITESLLLISKKKCEEHYSGGDHAHRAHSKLAGISRVPDSRANNRDS